MLKKMLFPKRFSHDFALIPPHPLTMNVWLKSESPFPQAACEVPEVTHDRFPSRLIRTVLPKAAPDVSRHLRRFRRDEDGAIVAFTLFVLLLLLASGGIAIDVMRHEMQRAQLQNTADSAVLAAAGAPASADIAASKAKAKQIVEDYFAKAGLSNYLDEIDPEKDIIVTLNSAKVGINASMTMDTYLMKLSGIDTLSTKASSTAERRVPKLEVAMVLDVSGSMANNSKLVNLQMAGKQFVTTILGSAKPGDAVISIVPFSWDVAPGPAIFNALNVDIRHNYSTCLQFSDSDFDDPSIDPAVQQTQLIFSSEYDSGFDRLNSNYRTCFTNDYAEILAFSTTESVLHSKIDALVAEGNTSGNTGMKWGAALLDPKFRHVNAHMTAAALNLEELPEVSVPSNYNEAETLKFIVMMGDGQNTYSNEFPLNSDYRGTDSYLHEVVYEDMVFDYAYHIYRHTHSNSPSRCGQRNWECVYTSETKTTYFLYNPSQNRYESVSDSTRYSPSEFENLENTLDGFISKQQLSWEMAWGRMSPDFLDKKFYYGDAEDDFEDHGRVSGWEKDQRMRDICGAVKDQGVVVYTIGFEVGINSTAETELKSCATSDAHYYRAQGININDAFSSIASNIVNLRLTQ